MSTALATIIAVTMPFFASVTFIALYALRGANPAERVAILRALAQLAAAMRARPQAGRSPRSVGRQQKEP